MNSISLRFLEFLDALSNGEVFLGTIFAHNKETARFLKIRVSSNLKVRKVCHFGLTSLVERDNLLSESLIICFQAITVLL